MPDDLKDPKVLAKILALLAKETARADEAEKHLKETKELLVHWQDISKKQSELAAQLEISAIESASEARELRNSISLMKTSLSEYEAETSRLRKEADKYRSRQKWWLIGGIVIGASTNLIQNR